MHVVRRGFVLGSIVVASLPAAALATAHKATGGAQYGEGAPAAERDAPTSAPTSDAPTAGAPSSDAPSTAGPTVAGTRARLVRGIAYAPAAAPDAVKQAVWAANEIQDRPYRYGGGHGGFGDTGYDCSGTISYALNGGDLVDAPLDSSSFMRWGAAGRGAWITVYTNPGHAYVVIAGLRLDTSRVKDPGGEKGPRWRAAKRETGGFTARHPVAL